MENVASPQLEVPQVQPGQNWQIRGEIPAAPVSPLYKLGMAATALAMVALPLLYVGLIGVLGWWLYQHATHDVFGVFEDTKNAKGALALYFGPIVIGGLVIVFMIKPLFARRPKSIDPRAITREQEPRLFTFIDQICDLVHAPRPSRVQLDLQVNASASFRRGFVSFLGQDLVLTIGLPLVAGLNTRQLGGVLAHEFGHFAQGAGMRLTYIIRTVNAWFSRVVYERDAWDQHLATAARSIDLRIGIFLHTARAMIWLTRKILWVFMMAGHGISCFMSRQMEFDADHYEIQLSGSRGFAETATRLRQLNVGWQRSISLQQEAFHGKRLVNDLSGLIALESHRLPPDVVEGLAKFASESKTGWFDTHPADADRTRAAERAQSSGVMVAEGPATELFADFAATSQSLTDSYYREECELDLEGVKFQSLEAMNAEAAERLAGQQAIGEYFGDLLSIRTLFFLSPADLERPLFPSEELRIRHRALLEKVPPIMEELMETDGYEIQTAKARALLAAGFTIKKADFHLPAASPEGVGAAVKALAPRLQQHRAALDEAVNSSTERLVAGLRLHGDAFTTEAAASAHEVRRLLGILGRLAGAEQTIVDLRNQLTAFRLLLENGTDDVRWNTVASQLTESIQGYILEILNRLQGAEYPFNHGSGAISIADYLRESPAHENKHLQAYIQADMVFEKLINTYQRILARLAVLAREAEATVTSTPPALAIA